MTWLEAAESPRETAQALSPLHGVRAGLPPTLLIHSDADPRVPYRDAVRLADALERAGVPAELVTMRSEGHLTREHPQAEVARGHAATRAFLARHGVLTDADA